MNAPKWQRGQEAWSFRIMRSRMTRKVDPSLTRSALTYEREVDKYKSDDKPHTKLAATVDDNTLRDWHQIVLETSYPPEWDE